MFNNINSFKNEKNSHTPPENGKLENLRHSQISKISKSTDVSLENLKLTEKCVKVLGLTFSAVLDFYNVEQMCME